MSKRYVSNIKGVPGSRIIKNINEAFPELNTAWLLTGEGEMLIDYSEKSSIDDFEESRAPILPTTVAGTPNIDILEYVQNNMQDVERSRIIVIDTPIDFWHIIRDDALAPTFRVGDKVALLAYEKGEESPVPGKIYAVDTKIYGLIIRRLIPCRNGGYLAKSLNEEKYPKALYDGKNQEVKSALAKIRYIARYLIHSEKRSNEDAYKLSVEWMKKYHYNFDESCYSNVISDAIKKARQYPFYVIEKIHIHFEIHSFRIKCFSIFEYRRTAPLVQQKTAIFKYYLGFFEVGEGQFIHYLKKVFEKAGKTFRCFRSQGSN
jgi:hypothetical protein